MDYNIKDVGRTVSELRRQVLELQRVIDQLQVSEFRYSPAEERYEQRTTKTNSKGQVSHTGWDNVPIVTGDGLPGGDETNRYLTWDTVDKEWEVSTLKYPEGDATNNALIWDDVSSKWIPGVVSSALPSGGGVNQYLTKNAGGDVIWDYVRWQ